MERKEENGLETCFDLVGSYIQHLDKDNLAYIKMFLFFFFNVKAFLMEQDEIETNFTNRHSFLFSFLILKIQKKKISAKNTPTPNHK